MRLHLSILVCKAVVRTQAGYQHTKHIDSQVKKMPYVVVTDISTLPSKTLLQNHG